MNWHTSRSLSVKVAPLSLWSPCPHHTSFEAALLLPRANIAVAQSRMVNMSNIQIRNRYDEAPECAFEPSRLNFALHVRMGDRRAIERPTLEYFRLLETFMEAIREGVVEKGLNPPMFHVFSETLLPCPTADNATFDEFPVWPVGADQVSYSWRG